MFLEKHTLHFSDGRIVTAQIESGSPQGLYKITWSGDIKSIPKVKLLKEGNSTNLKLLLKGLGRELGAVLKTESSGQFDSWAE